MADNTKIEWADATVNAVNGCSVVSPGCTNCYAMRLAGTRMRNHPSRAGLTMPTKAGPVWTGEVRLNESALMQPIGWTRPRRIFWNAHGDLFHDAVPDEWIDRVFAVCALTPQHTHMILTKRTKRMREYANNPATPRRIARVIVDMLIAKTIKFDEQTWPVISEGDIDAPSDILIRWPLPNVWSGTSVEDQTRADERIPHLLATPAAVRFLSCEPLLGPVDIRKFMWPVCKSMPAHYRTWAEAEAAGDLTYKRQALVSASATFLDWVIVGGESGPGARPMHPDWARSLRDQCQAAGVAFHFKQWGAWAPHPSGEPVTMRQYHDQIGYIDKDTGERKRNPNRHTDETMRRIGKKLAGRLLDGREWNDVPSTSARGADSAGAPA